MSRIREAFQKEKAFIPFMTAGDPDLETTKKAIREAVLCGADLIEIGIPFSDPTAEGPVIQEANLRALSNRITTDDIFAMVEDLRRDVTIPLVFMTYANVVYSYGITRFAERCSAVGMDGLILPDVPYEEKEEFAPAFRERGIDFISMIAPTSEERIKQIAADAEGFLYIVSSLGVTGTRTSITTDLSSMVAKVRKATDLPCAIGFGISTPEQAKEMAALSDGAIVGSAIVKLFARYGTDAPEKAGEFIRTMKEAVRAAS